MQTSFPVSAAFPLWHFAKSPRFVEQLALLRFLGADSVSRSSSIKIAHVRKDASRVKDTDMPRNSARLGWFDVFFQCVWNHCGRDSRPVFARLETSVRPVRGAIWGWSRSCVK